ncbi:hypothetical protein MOMUL_20110 [Moorella mulderi DSM 14980]|uniref:Uncharacterized protein n=2 Tax=Neomoorella TaxID=44260 RepID=A0A151AWR5_9FIRM|nr:hypothetical protein MOMUL_20110 [Moorella mulderi DSM 14980]
MYGPYLIAFIDDASRLITNAQFFWEQNYTAVQMTLVLFVLCHIVYLPDCDIIFA